MESEQTVKGLGSSNLPLSGAGSRARLALVASALVLTCAPLAVKADSSGMLSGRIVDARTGSPVGGVRVGAYSASGTVIGLSRADGRFAILGIAAGREVVTLEADGFEARECAYRVWPGGDTRLTFVLFANRPGGLPAERSAAERATAQCPAAPVGGGETQDVYVIGD